MNPSMPLIFFQDHVLDERQFNAVYQNHVVYSLHYVLLSLHFPILLYTISLEGFFSHVVIVHLIAGLYILMRNERLIFEEYH